jgi:hypothetical protein
VTGGHFRTLVQEITSLSFMQEVPASNFNRDIACPVRDSRDIPQPVELNAETVNTVMLR